MPHQPTEHERISEMDARAKLQGIEKDPFDNLQAKMLAKNPPEKETNKDSLPMNFVRDLNRQRRQIGPIHSVEEAYGHLSAGVKELEIALGEKDTGKAKKLIRKIACVAICSETLAKKKE